MELDYDHKVDLSSYKSADNQYTIPSNGIIMFSGHLYDKSVLSYLYVNDIQLTIIGGATGYNGGFWNAGAYSQFITKNSKVYTDGGGILDVQYFIPFK